MSFFGNGHQDIKKAQLKTVCQCVNTQRAQAVSTDFEEHTKVANVVEETFDWFKNWWPVQAEDSLKTDRPNKITLLGNDYVVWKGHSGEWIAMDDQCPHRMAPLSEGRIEKDGNLLCSYHAWRFNECGKCVKIPHAESEAAHNVACNSRRSAIQIYPCKSRGGIIWIWPDRSETAQEESEMEGIPIEDDIAEYLEQGSKDRTLLTYVSYLPYGYDVLMENLSDPCHFIVSHHGLLPHVNRYLAQPIYAKLVDKIGTLPVTASLAHVPEFDDSDWGNAEFQKPCSFRLYYGTKESKSPKSTVLAYAVPVTPDKSLVMHIPLINYDKNHLKKMNLFQKRFSRMTQWMSHTYLSNRLFDGDSVFLYEQGKKIKKLGSEYDPVKAYFMPSSADQLVITFRKWFETEAKNGVAYGNSTSKSSRKELTRHELLNRYERHTKHCKVCTDALKNIKLSISVFKTLSFTSLVMAGAFIMQALSIPTMQWTSLLKNVNIWVTLALSIIFFFAVKYLQDNIVPLFYFEDHVHAEKD